MNGWADKLSKDKCKGAEMFDKEKRRGIRARGRGVKSNEAGKRDMVKDVEVEGWDMFGKKT